MAPGDTFRDIENGHACTVGQGKPNGKCPDRLVKDYDRPPRSCVRLGGCGEKQSTRTPAESANVHGIRPGIVRRCSEIYNKMTVL